MYCPLSFDIAGRLFKEGIEHLKGIHKQSPLLSEYLFILAAAIIYFLAVKFGGALFSFKPSGITVIWLPSGIGLVMMLKWGVRTAPFIYIADFFGNISGVLQSLPFELAIYHTMFSSVADLIAPILGMFLFRRYLYNGLNSSRDIFIFFICTCLIPIIISSSLISINLVTSGIIEKERFYSMIGMLFFADSLGVFWVFHIYSGWQHKQIIRLKSWFMLSTLLLTFILALGFYGYSWLIYLVAPILVYSAFRDDQFKVGLLSSVTMIIIIVATANGLGPLGNVSSIESNTQVMVFIFAISYSLLGVSIQNHKLKLSETQQIELQRNNKSANLLANQYLQENLLAKEKHSKQLEIGIKDATRDLTDEINLLRNNDNKNVNEQRLTVDFDELVSENAFLSKARNCVLDHLQDSDFDVKALATYLYMSRSTLQRKIESQSHYTAAQFIRYIRLKKAHSYIQKNVHRTLAETAFAVGFKHPGYFSKLYREYCQQLQRNK